MKIHSTSLIIILICFVSLYAEAQTFEGLKKMNAGTFEVFYSPGAEKKCSAISLQLNKAVVYYEQMLAFKPELTVLILNPADWPKFTSFPVYGMPHYNPNKTLIVASEDNPYWKSFIASEKNIPESLRVQINSVYRGANDSLSMEAFFDLLALHELGHAFTSQAKINMQRKWMGELYVNILLHTFIAENDPASLPALTLFPEMVISQGAKQYKYTALADLESSYNEIGKNFPKNYGWYQCRWHKAAGDIYNANGKNAAKRIWLALKSNQEKLTDQQLLALFKNIDASAVTDMIRNWDNNTLY